MEKSENSILANEVIENTGTNLKFAGIAVIIIGIIIGLSVSFIKVSSSFDSEQIFVWSAFAPYLLASIIGGSLVIGFGCVVDTITKIKNLIVKNERSTTN